MNGVGLEPLEHNVVLRREARLRVAVRERVAALRARVPVEPTLRTVIAVELTPLRTLVPIELPARAVVSLVATLRAIVTIKTSAAIVSPRARVPLKRAAWAIVTVERSTLRPSIAVESTVVATRSVVARDSRTAVIAASSIIASSIIAARPVITDELTARAVVSLVMTLRPLIIKALALRPVVAVEAPVALATLLRTFGALSSIPPVLLRRLLRRAISPVSWAAASGFRALLSLLRTTLRDVVGVKIAGGTAARGLLVLGHGGAFRVGFAHET
ncbi:hypothetical protein GCM10027267_21840 [Paramicrobacterium agarici]